MDTSIMEYTAEDLISHKLTRAGLLVAKPKFDQDGSDLLIFLDVGDGAKFCRVQCKGRSLINSKQTQVDVFKKYVSDAFILFLFVETGQKDITNLFCFMGNDIRQNWQVRDHKYELSITEKKIKNEFSDFIFDTNKINQIKKAILNVDVKGEFNKIIHGYAEIMLDSFTVSASGTIKTPNS